MADSTELFDLIRALSMQEKRHFKLYAGRYSAHQSNYLKLFDAIAGQKTYNEQKLKKKLANESFIKHLPFEKHHLHQLITRSLRLYHTGRNLDIQIKEMLFDAEILHEKSLYGHCRKVLQKARKLAQNNERFAFIPEITRLESRLYDLQGLDQVYEQEATSLDKMRVINRYRRLSNRVALLVASAHHVRRRSEIDAFEKILKDPLMQSEDRATSFTARVYYFYIRAVYAEMKGDLAGAYRSRKRFVELAEKNPAQLGIHVKNYLAALNNLAISQLELSLFDEVKETVKKIRAIPGKLKAGKGEDVHVTGFVFATILSLNLAIRTGQFSEIRTHLPAIEKQLEKFSNKIQLQFLIVIYNSIKYIYFGNNELRKALQWSNRLMALENKDVRRDIRAMSRIFDLILHYELGNTELLEYIIRSTYRYLLKSDRMYKVETILLNYLRRNTHLSSREEIQNSFRDLHAQLLPLSRDRFEKKAFEEFDLLSWLQAKMRERPFAEILREKAEKSGKTRPKKP